MKNLNSPDFEKGSIVVYVKETTNEGPRVGLGQFVSKSDPDETGLCFVVLFPIFEENVVCVRIDPALQMCLFPSTIWSTWFNFSLCPLAVSQRNQLDRRDLPMEQQKVPFEFPLMRILLAAVAQPKNQPEAGKPKVEPVDLEGREPQKGYSMDFADQQMYPGIANLGRKYQAEFKNMQQSLPIFAHELREILADCADLLEEKENLLFHDAT